MLNPAYPKTKDALTAKPTGNGTPDKYSDVWKKNGVVIPGQNSNTLDLSVAGHGDKGDNIKVKISGPDEGENAVEPAEVTIINSDPVTPARKFVAANTRTLQDQLTGTATSGAPGSFITSRLPVTSAPTASTSSPLTRRAKSRSPQPSKSTSCASPDSLREALS